MKKVSLSFIRLSVPTKIPFCRNVVNDLTDNPFFPSPDEPLTNAKAGVDKLEASELAARDGSHTAIAARNADEEEVDRIFRILAAYVERISAGDEVKILSSGFQLTKQPATASKAVLAVTEGANSGSVKLIAKAVEKAGAYLWQYAKDAIPDTETGWMQAGTSTQATFDIAGLTVASKYYFRVAAITPDGTTDYTAPVLKVVS
ncbi:MAG: hypothetical protein PHV20_01405 [Bacteroidales bacterium]|nr:hypothetical protein [Bacteroidales bacterium]